MSQPSPVPRNRKKTFWIAFGFLACMAVAVIFGRALTGTGITDEHRAILSDAAAAETSELRQQFADLPTATTTAAVTVADCNLAGLDIVNILQAFVARADTLTDEQLRTNAETIYFLVDGWLDVCERLAPPEDVEVIRRAHNDMGDFINR